MLQRGLHSPSAATQTGLIGPVVPGVEEAAVRWVVTDQQLLHRPHGGDVVSSEPHVILRNGSVGVRTDLKGMTQLTAELGTSLSSCGANGEKEGTEHDSLSPGFLSLFLLE